ncbi:MAG: signal recognition particle-docking protein FtsY [Nanoarchaeota archaeon]
MFKFLKEKLKGWISKAEKPETEELPEKPEKKDKEDKKKDKSEKHIQKSKKDTKRQEQKANKKEEELQIQQEEIVNETKEEKFYPVKEGKDKEEKPKQLFSLFKKKLTEEKFEELFQDLELILLQNNVALEVVDKIKSDFKNNLIGEDLAKINLKQKLKESIEEILVSPPDFLNEIKQTLSVKKPFIITFVGINGVGKTTTIAKVADFLTRQKLSCCLAAADTYRAASIEQLQKHADNLKIPIIKKDYGTDPASVGFDAIQYAKKHHIDIVLIDTAGRMHTKDSLMKEIEKISRVAQSDMKIFIGESITGNDAIEQAKSFDEAIGLTGIILSKADVDEKGGTAISVGYITKKPILFLGTGQDYKDLEVFDKYKFIESLGLS